MTVLLLRIFSFWFKLHVIYNWQAAAWKLFPKMLCILIQTLLGVMFNYSECDTYSHPTPISFQGF